MKSAEGLGAKVVLGWSRPLFLSFIFGFVVRLIPELLSFSYPIGYDPIYYAWRIKSGVVWNHWSQVFSTWLLYATLIGLFDITQVNPFVLVKFTAALLFGFNACGIYYFATKALHWTTKKGLLASVFFSLQTAALALSSNFYRNMLGLGILLFTLPLIKDEIKSTRRFLVLTLLSVLVAFSHEYASVILFGVVLSLLIIRFLKRTKTNLLKSVIAVAPALVLFLANVYFIVFHMPYEVEKNVIWAYEPKADYQREFFFLKNYLAVSESAQIYPMYLDLVSQIFSLFVILYLVALPLVLVGFFKDSALDTWTALLLIGSFSALVTPFFALDLWYRWMLMLVYPFTFYSVNGITKLLRSSRKTINSTFRLRRCIELTEKATKLILILPFSLGLFLMATLMQGNAVPLGDVDDTVRAVQWLDPKMDDGSALLTHVVFSNWAKLYLDKSHVLIYFKDDIEGAIDVALQSGFNNVYLVWWNENTDRYGITVPSYFVSIFSSNRISVFEYSK